MRNIIIGLLKIVLITTLVVVLTLGVWVGFRGSQPMEMVEAKGITFWQFMDERWQRHVEVDANIRREPQYFGCRNDIVRMFPVNFVDAFNFAYACANPETKLAYAFKYWEEKQPDVDLPKMRMVNTVEIPDAFWAYFERVYWRGLVTLDYLAGECELGPVDFERIEEGNSNA